MSKTKSLKENGIILIDKPAGISSAGVVAQVKRITGAKKVGHTGTLDPFATGLMICCLNSATRLSRFFLESDKRYEARLILGTETDTMDSTGEIIAENQGKVPGPDSAELFGRVLKSFEGPQEQLPPVYSALKHNGVPLYRLARKGTPVQKPPRQIRVYRTGLVNYDPPSARFEVDCSTGTYIRTLASDIGKKMGCGAHLDSLRRTGSGRFDVENAVSPEFLASLDNPGERLIPMADALSEMKTHLADAQLEKKISNGVKLNPGDGIRVGAEETDEVFFKILDRQGDLIAVAVWDKTKYEYNYCCVFHN